MLKQLGGQNASRFELQVNNHLLHLENMKNGSVLTDMDVFHKDGTKTHLSAKLGPSLTFINPKDLKLYLQTKM